MHKDVKVIFDEALGMEPNDIIAITLQTKRELDSLRVSLYRQNRLYRESTNTAFQIVITTSTIGGVYLLKLEKIPTANVIMQIFKADGSIKEKNVSKIADQLEQAEVAIASEDDVRIRGMMEEDGWTGEEIQKYFKEKANEERCNN